MSQVIDKVLQIHTCFIVRINIAYAHRLVFIVYVVLLLPYGGVTGIYLIANPVNCNICESLTTFPSVTNVTPPSASGSVASYLDYAVCPGTQSGG
jgi:hypothetical protein